MCRLVLDTSFKGFVKPNYSEKLQGSFIERMLLS